MEPQVGIEPTPPTYKEGRLTIILQGHSEQLCDLQRRLNVSTIGALGVNP